MNQVSGSSWAGIFLTLKYLSLECAKSEKRMRRKDKNGAGGGNRTRMEQAPLDFESSASTSFTTPAIRSFISKSPQVVNRVGYSALKFKVS
jgi:hypothetical protein